MGEYTAFLERKEWFAAGISNDFTSSKCETSNKETGKADEIDDIDKLKFYSKSQFRESIRFHDSNKGILTYEYLGPCGAKRRPFSPSYGSSYYVPPESTPEWPLGVQVLEYKQEYETESNWIEMLSGPKIGQLYKEYLFPDKTYKYKRVTVRRDLGLPNFTFNFESKEFTASRNWTGVVSVMYYYDFSGRYKEILKSQVRSPIEITTFLNPLGYDATGKEVDIFILPDEHHSFWTGRSNWSELDCLLCNPITSGRIAWGERAGSSITTEYLELHNFARYTHITECTGPVCRQLYFSNALKKISANHAWTLELAIYNNPNLLTSDTWNPYNEGNSFPDERIKSGVYDKQLKFTNENIFYVHYEVEDDPGENHIYGLSMAKWMAKAGCKANILNGNYDRFGASFRRFPIYVDAQTTLIVYVVVADFYGPEENEIHEWNISETDDVPPAPFFTCTPDCISEPCEWKQETWGEDEQTQLSQWIKMPCPVPWLCGLREVSFWTETKGWVASVKPEFGIKKAFGDVEGDNPYIDMSEVEFAVSWNLDAITPFMIPGEYFYFIYHVNFDNDSECQMLYGPSGYFETHCLTSGMIIGCGYEDGSEGGEGTEYDSSNSWVFNENFRWLVWFKGIKYWLRSSDFTKYRISERAFIYKNGLSEIDDGDNVRHKADNKCRGMGLYHQRYDISSGEELSFSNVVYELDSASDILVPNNLAGYIGD